MPRDDATQVPGQLPSDVAMAPRRSRRGGAGGGAKRPEQPGYAPDLLIDDKAERRRKRFAIAAVLIVMSVLSLFVDAGWGRFFDPSEVFASYSIWFEQAFGGGAHGCG